MNNLCQFALTKNGSVNYLKIPASESQGLGLTNPTIFYDKETKKLLVNIRHVQYALYHSEGEQKFQTPWGPLAYLNPEDDVTLTTKNYLCELDPYTLQVDEWNLVDTKDLDVQPLWEFVGLEDARLVKWNSHLFLSGVRRDTTTNGVGRIELSTVENFKEVSRSRIEPPAESYCEKNWMPVEDLPYHYVKWTSPTEVVKVSSDIYPNNDTRKGGATSETVVLKEQTVKLPRDIRGGSQVICIGDYRVAVTHEVDLWQNEQNRKDAQYYHRIIVWDKDWNIVHTSQEFKFLTGHIEFSCGMALVEENIMITFGFQDSTAYILSLPVSAFEEFLGFDFGMALSENTVSGSTPAKLRALIQEPLNPEVNFDLGEYYFKHGHFSSALSFYLRAAEYGSEKNLVYKSLLLVAKSLSSLGRRTTTELGLWLNALSFDPEMPAAYFHLSQYWERMGNHHMAYSYAVMGLDRLSHKEGGMHEICDVKAYQLYFQKAVSAWWIGKGSESREIFFALADNADRMTEEYRQMVQKNITSLGSGPDPFVPYFKGYHEKLKFKFEGSEKIEKNFSQTYQDMFVLAALNGKSDGFYLEIGAADPFKGSNSALLESLGWKGTSVEILEHEVAKFKSSRKNEILHADATTIDYNTMLFGREVVDYLQVDCEPPATTFKILKMLPFDTTKFGVITYEHDYYADVSKKYRQLSRDFLTKKGYVLVAGNIAPDHKSCYEDWWVHPDLIAPEVIDMLKDPDKPVLCVKDYMLN
jgi:tetratricopeptide (TPR) repeat protein